jgi:hypothetical protein
MIGHLKSKLVRFVVNIVNYIDPYGYVASEQLDYVYKSELKFNHFVSVRSIINNCTFHNRNQRSDIDLIDFKIVTNKTELNVISIFINSDSIDSFVRNNLRQCKSKFILFVGNSDIRFDCAMMNAPSMMVLLKHPLVLKLYIQNLGFLHEKVSFMPIGLDFHTLWEKPRKNGFFFRISPLLHEARLKNIISESNNLDARVNLIYCNWHFNINRGDRLECFQQVNKDLCYFEKNQVDRFENYLQISKYRYVLCPAGLGWDSYRIWETFLIGSIPILKSSEFTIHFIHLPCIIVNEWSDLTLDFLEREFDRIKSISFDMTKLYNKYWLKVISDI